MEGEGTVTVCILHWEKPSTQSLGISRGSTARKWQNWHLHPVSGSKNANSPPLCDRGEICLGTRRGSPATNSSEVLGPSGLRFTHREGSWVFSPKKGGEVTYIFFFFFKHPTSWGTSHAPQVLTTEYTSFCLIFLAVLLLCRLQR